MPNYLKGLLQHEIDHIARVTRLHIPCTFGDSFATSQSAKQPVFYVGSVSLHTLQGLKSSQC
jgi:hypothetical protein